MRKRIGEQEAGELTGIQRASGEERKEREFVSQRRDEDGEGENRKRREEARRLEYRRTVSEETSLVMIG